MGDILLVFLVSNSIIFSGIFWILTFISKLFYQDKYSTFKLNFYECGFKAVNGIKINISIQFILVALFLIIYDSEFLILYSGVFNLFYFNSLGFLLLLIFIFLLVWALIIDYWYSALEWTL